ncbi:MAG TPA: OmpA family protein [Blastocatellia bacterium]|jgi:outer membrane protein OmpA-like peptidoglycan-associated protein|nr:OmpA family protein [Blastocatellia bacterium]
MNFASTILVALLAIIATPQQSMPDVKGSADHPLFSGRMPGYRISAYEQQDFKSHKFLTDPQQVIDGKYTEIRYELKDKTKDPGPLTVRRFYENAVKSAGGQILPLLLDSSREYRNAMKITRNGVEVWVELNTYVKPDYILYIVERAPMKQMITADAMATAIDKDGFVPLDIHFATGKAEILPESRPIIDEIVSLLKKRPNLRIGVEGHTDSNGNPAANKTLSNARAKAVAEAIAAAGISSNRLDPVGYGQERPIADNRTEEGRAKNRRVELVKR